MRVFNGWWSISATNYFSKRKREPHGFIFAVEACGVGVFGHYVAINEAMKVIEAENDDLKAVLPKTYNRLDKELLVSLLKNFAWFHSHVE